MASMAISGASSPNAAQAAGTPMASAAQSVTPAKPAPAVLKPDTVKLSVAAQAKMMHRQGQSPALIAAMLGTNVAAVDGYLNIKAVAPASTTPAAVPVAQAASSSATGEMAAGEPAIDAPQSKR